jgi:hypothetical protein
MREERGEAARGAQRLGPAADVAHALHERGMDREQRGGQDRRARAREPQQVAQQQRDVQRVQRELRGVEAARVEAPHREVERVRDVHERAEAVEPEEEADVRRVAQRGVGDDEPQVVVDEGDVQRPRVRQQRQRDEERRDPEARGGHRAGDSTAAYIRLRREITFANVTLTRSSRPIRRDSVNLSSSAARCGGAAA